MTQQINPVLAAAAAKLIQVGNAPAAGCGCGGPKPEMDAGQCPLPQPEFPRFFAGQCVQPDDLNAVETRVFTHEQMRARYLIGWGIACGFRIGIDNAQTNDKGIPLAGSTMRVEHGYGLDRYGRDVYLAADRRYPLETLLAEREARIKAAMADPWCTIPGCQPTPPTHYCIAVRYRECDDKLVPSYAQQCGTPKTVCEPSRIREDVEIRIFGDNEFPPIPAGDTANQWCGLPEADQALAQLFSAAITIPQGTTDVASSANWTPYVNLAGSVSTFNDAGAIAARGSCEDLLHLPRACAPCMDWPWVPLACFTLDGGMITNLDCRVRRVIYSLQEIEALVVRVFCLLVHQPGGKAGTNLGALVNLFK
jgi:hypothetical protein